MLLIEHQAVKLMQTIIPNFFQLLLSAFRIKSLALLRSIIASVLFFFTFGIWELATAQEVVINEIMHNPEGSVDTNSMIVTSPCQQANAKEFIELYNPSPCKSVDISCWILGATLNDRRNTRDFVSCYDAQQNPVERFDQGWFTIPAGTVIPPLGLITIGGAQADGTIDYKLSNYVPVNSSNYCGSARFFLNSRQGWLALFKPDLSVVDGVYWVESATSEINTDTTFFDTYNNKCTCDGVEKLMPSGRDLNRRSLLRYVGKTNYLTTPTGINSFQRLPDGGCWKTNKGSGSAKGCNGNCWKIPDVSLLKEQSGRKAFCIGEMLNFTVDFPKPQKDCANEVTYEWFSVPPLAPPSTAQVYRVPAIQGVVYHLKIKFNGCEYDLYDSAMVNVVDKPEAGWQLDKPEVCEKDTVTVSYTGEPIEGMAYTWTFEGGAQSATASGVGPHKVVWNTLGDKRISVRVSLGTNCTSTFADFVRVKPIPKGVPVVYTTELCANDTSVIDVTGLAGSAEAFDFDFDGGRVFPIPGSKYRVKVVWDYPGTKYFRCKIRDTLLSCISKPEPIQIIVRPIPVAKFSVYVPPSGTCEMVSIYATGQTDSSATYHWYTSGADRLNSDYSNKITTKEITGAGEHKIRWLTPGEKKISLWVTQFGCTSDVYTQTIYYDLDYTRLEKLNIPNAFSPNGDGVNDEYKLPYYRNDCAEYQMEIFNRWGQKVFTLPKDGLSWNGKFNGSYVPEGAYVYRLRLHVFDGREVDKIGTITVIR